jgi:enoyl-[acyl-carrier protein] reductase I
MVHALAFAPREAIAGDFLEGMTREAFRQTHDISFTAPALARPRCAAQQGRLP